MNNDIYLIGEVGEDITLKNIIEKVNNSDKNLPLNVWIHSEGGGVYEGVGIYKYFKSLKQEVNTISLGLVASIASVFFLSGNKRVANITDKFFIHLPIGGNRGNASDLERTAKELRGIEKEISEIYASETTISKKDALNLMVKNEMVDISYLKDSGFINDLTEIKAVAKLDNYNMSEQLTKKDAETMFEAFGNKLSNFFSPKEQAPDNKVVQDANGTEIDFFNLKSSDTINIGDEAQIDNKKPTGKYVVGEAGNVKVYNFENGILKTIQDVSETDKIAAQLKEQSDLVASLEAEKLDFIAKLEAKENDFKTIESDFKKLKNEITSGFEYTKNQIPPKEDFKSESRTNFKSKYKD